jgi:hypothetical protein
MRTWQYESNDEATKNKQNKNKNRCGDRKERKTMPR